MPKNSSFDWYRKRGRVNQPRTHMAIGTPNGGTSCHIPGRLLIIWDGLPGHCSRAVWDFVQQPGRLWLEFLPVYAPESVEYLWSHWKQHEPPNFCPRSFGQLNVHARCALQPMRRRRHEAGNGGHSQGKPTAYRASSTRRHRYFAASNTTPKP